MKQISCFDLRRVTWLSKLTSEELISPKNDYLIEPVLIEIGMDVEKPIIYSASKHRTLDNSVTIDYTLCGEVTSDLKFLYGPLATREDRILANGRVDLDFATALAELGDVSPDYGYENEAIHESQLEPNWREEEKLLEIMKQNLKIIRGDIWSKEDPCKLKPWKEYRNNGKL